MARGTHKKPPSPASEALWATRKEEILTQAATLFARHGYSETDTQLLAETIGVGKGTVYRYFPSKRELFLAATDRVMRMMRSGSMPGSRASQIRWLASRAAFTNSSRSLPSFPNSSSC